MSAKTISSVASVAFGAFCIGSALPFIGIPIPNKAAVHYYADKSAYMAGLTGHRITTAQAQYLSAVLRTAVGAGCIYPGTRQAALLVNLGIVIRGTFIANRDGRPMWPQWGMLGAMSLCLILGRV